MPRYRFSWGNLPPSLLRALKRDLDLDGEASTSLRAAYGARPSVDFVQEAWGILLDNWLKRDSAARAEIVEQLRDSRLGDMSIGVRSAANQLVYLRSCRNGATLRNIVADTLIAAGERTGSAEVTSAPRVGQSPRSDSWQQFATSLAATLSALEEDHYLIVQHKDRQRFVQFAAQGSHGLRAEMVSNAYLEADDQIPDEAIQKALALGWVPPTGGPEQSTPENDPDGSPNYYRDWAQPVPLIDVARLAADTLVDVFAVPHPGWLQYDAFTTEGTKILLPTLGLKARPSDTRPDDAVEIPVDADSIAERLVALLRQVSGNEELQRDSEGDIALNYGSSMVFVRVFGDPPIIRVFSPVLREVGPHARLHGLINNLNTEHSFTRWSADDGVIVATVDLFGAPFVEQHVLHACGVLGETANTLDEQLQEELGGRTFFGDYVSPKPSPGTGGYL